MQATLSADAYPQRRAALYRARTAEARWMAQDAAFDDSRATLLKIAKQWEHLAAQLDTGNSDAGAAP